MTGRSGVSWQNSHLSFSRSEVYASSPMDSKKLAQLCRDYAENKKAENVVVLDVRKLSSITDFFVIASGTSEPHLRAIESEILDRLATEQGIRPNSTDGNVQTNWLVADFFDVIVHVMKADVRERYDLEGLWGDAPKVARPRRKSKTAETSEEPLN
jgi:ribosome-associated protein